MWNRHARGRAERTVHALVGLRERSHLSARSLLSRCAVASASDRLGRRWTERRLDRRSTYVARRSAARPASSASRGTRGSVRSTARCSRRAVRRSRRIRSSAHASTAATTSTRSSAKAAWARSTRCATRRSIGAFAMKVLRPELAQDDGARRSLHPRSEGDGQRQAPERRRRSPTSGACRTASRSS